MDLSKVMEMRAKYLEAPKGMAKMDLPHLSKSVLFPKKNSKQRDKYLEDNWGRANPNTRYDQFNDSVRKIREYLNKLTPQNYKKIKDKLLKKFQFNAQLLKQLSKMIFLKATTEQNYIEIYVDLVEELFKKFNDKENVEMNFKQLILSKCKKEFYKEQLTDNEDDFSKGTILVFDEEEINHRKKMRVFGNIKLLGELFTRGHVSENVILECLEFLNSEISDESVDQIMFFLERIIKFVLFSRKQKKNKDPKLTVAYLEENLLNLLELSKEKKLSSRIRFRIQDFKDSYETEWRAEFDKRLKRVSP